MEVSHLSYEDRKIIQTGIENGSTKTSIDNTIGKDNSTKVDIRNFRNLFNASLGETAFGKEVLQP